MGVRLSYDQVKENIESFVGYKLLSKMYTGYQDTLEIRCPNNHVFSSTWNKFSQGRRCTYCAGNAKKKLQEVYDLFYSKNYIPLFTTYKNSTTRLPYICLDHQKEVLYIDFSSLKRGRGCKYCFRDRISGENAPRWKDGRSDLHDYLRKQLKEWKKESIKQCEYKCVITHNRFDVVHHLYGFDKIFEEAFLELNLKIHENISDYTDDELKLIKNKILELHFKYPLGVCLSNKVHDRFHELYGFGKNTPEQFEEFKKRWYKGEFADLSNDEPFLVKQERRV